jgi:hypothetical protein
MATASKSERASVREATREIDAREPAPTGATIGNARSGTIERA